MKKVEGALSKQAAMNSQLAKTGVATGAGEVYDSTLAAMRSVGAATTGTEAIKARVITVSLEHLKPSALAFRDVANRVEIARGIDPSGLLTRDAVDHRIALFREFQRSNTAVVEAYQSLPDKLDRVFTAELGLSQSDAQACGEWLAATLNPERLLKAREQTALACEQAFIALGILRDEWGHWRMSSARDSLEFLEGFPPEKHPLFNAAAAEYKAAFDRLRALEAP